jgi:hypothetical protein
MFLNRSTNSRIFHKTILKIRKGDSHLEDETLLPPVRQWKFDFPIKTSRSQQSGVKSICSIGSHDHFDIDCLIETIHL